MAIGSAIERGSHICVNDESGTTLFQKAKGSGAKDRLVGLPISPSPFASLDHLHLGRARLNCSRGHMQVADRHRTSEAIPVIELADVAPSRQHAQRSL